MKHKENIHSTAKDAFEAEKSRWKKDRRNAQIKSSLTVFSPIFLLVLWEVLSRTDIIDPRLFPPPSSIVGTFIQMVVSGDLAHNLSISMFRIIGGFLLGAIPGILLGLLMGMFLPIRYFFRPIIMSLMPIPTIALMPVILFIFGIGEWGKLMTVAESVFFPVVINTAAGVSSIDQIYLDVAKNYGAKSKDFFLKIAFPGALPMMMEGIQMGQAIALLTIVAAEMIGANSGIGYLIWNSYKIFALKDMYVGLILISFFGYMFSILLRWLQKKLIPWQK